MNYAYKHVPGEKPRRVPMLYPGRRPIVILGSRHTLRKRLPRLYVEPNLISKEDDPWRPVR